jgi:hypothetical protein
MDMHADPEDVVQAEDYLEAGRPVDVAVVGQVETRELPAVRAGYRTEAAVGAAVGAKILAFEPRRKSAVIVAQSQDIYVGISQAGVQAGTSGAARWPALVPFVVTHLDEVWAIAVTGTTDISVLAEYWTE